MQGTKHLAYIPTPGFEHPRWSRIRFMSADPAAGGTPPAGTDPATDPKPTPPAAEDISSLPEWAQKQIADLRKENASDRTNAKKTAADEATAEILAKVQAALGGKTGDTAPTADELTAQLAASTSAATDAQRELAVYRAAATVTGADAPTLLDSRTFLTAIKDIDPTDSAALKAAVVKALTDNPRLKATQAAGKSGGDFTGGTGEGTITAERFAKMTAAEKNDLFNSDPTLYRQLTGRD